MENLLYQGLQLTLLGMGTVFTFLLVLTFFTKGMSWIIVNLLPSGQPASVPLGATGDVDRQRLTAIIAAAVKQHKKSRLPHR
ncbi:MAG: OadG family protein [Pseudohongiellaceae bacterium]